MKKLTTLILSCAMACSFCACSSSSTSTTTTTETTEKTTDPLSLDNFGFSVEKNSSSGDYEFILFNNSDYDVLQYEISYELINEEDEDLFLDVIEQYYSVADDLTEDDKVELFAGGNKYLESGEISENLPLYIGYGNIKDGYYSDNTTPTDEQFNLMQPHYLNLNIVKDDELYRCFYNLETYELEGEPETKKLNEWSDNEFSKLIEKPEDHIFISTYDEENNCFGVTIYNIDDSYCDNYADQLEAKGFTYNSDASESTGYSVYTNSDNYYVLLNRLSDASLQIIMTK